MPAFTAVGSELGFDDEVAPAWVTVPAGTTKNVLLKDAAGLNVGLRDPADKAFLTVGQGQTSAQGRIITLTAGATPKTVFVDVQNSAGAPVVSLEVAVKKAVTLSTFIAFVFDKKHRTTPLGLSAGLQIMEVANKILQPQTNLKMVRTDSGGFVLPFELPSGVPADFPPFGAPPSWDRPSPGLLLCVQSRPLGPEGCMPETDIALYKTTLENSAKPIRLPPDKLKEMFDAIRATQALCNIVNRISPRFDYNILFCADFDRSSGGLGATTGAFTPPAANGVELNCCLMPPAARGQSLAHELCHFLLRTTHVGPGRHSLGKKDLMAQAPGLDNIKIPKSQANAINPSPP